MPYHIKILLSGIISANKWWIEMSTFHFLSVQHSLRNAPGNILYFVAFLALFIVALINSNNNSNFRILPTRQFFKKNNNAKISWLFSGKKIERPAPTVICLDMTGISEKCLMASLRVLQRNMCRVCFLIRQYYTPLHWNKLHCTP